MDVPGIAAGTLHQNADVMVEGVVYLRDAVCIVADILDMLLVLVEYGFIDGRNMNRPLSGV